MDFAFEGGLANGRWRDTPNSLAGPMLERHTYKATTTTQKAEICDKNEKLKQKADFLGIATVKTEKNLEEFFL